MVDTGSRVATISLILSITAAVFMIYKNHNSRKILIGFLVFILGLTFLFNYMVSQEILKKRLRETYFSGDLAGREIIWPAVLGLIKKNILFGVGETGYRLFCLKEFGDYASPHNVILEILAYTGIIGLFIYLKFIYHLIYGSYMSYKKEFHIMPLLLLIPTFGFVLSGQALNVKIVWAIYALAASSIF
jgi:O-antigen ligase